MPETLHFVCAVQLGLLCLGQPVGGLGKATEHSLKFGALRRKDFSSLERWQRKQRAWLCCDAAQRGEEPCLCNRHKNGNDTDQKPRVSSQVRAIAATLRASCCSFILCSLSSTYFNSKREIWILFTCFQNYIWRLLSTEGAQKYQLQKLNYCFRNQVLLNNDYYLFILPKSVSKTRQCYAVQCCK